MYRSTFDVRRELAEPEDEITEEVPRPDTRQCEADDHSWKALESPHDHGTHQCEICRLEGFPKPKLDCSTDDYHDWHYLTPQERTDWTKCIMSGGRIGVSNRPVPDARCKNCTKMMIGSVVGYYSPHGLYARPYNGN